LERKGEGCEAKRLERVLTFVGVVRGLRLELLRMEARKFEKDSSVRGRRRRLELDEGRLIGGEVESVK
jgi:hypothetical protein